jgi:hypothetical protein
VSRRADQPIAVCGRGLRGQRVSELLGWVRIAWWLALALKLGDDWAAKASFSDVSLVNIGSKCSIEKNQMSFHVVAICKSNRNGYGEHTGQIHHVKHFGSDVSTKIRRLPEASSKQMQKAEFANVFVWERWKNCTTTFFFRRRR